MGKQGKTLCQRLTTARSSLSAARMISYLEFEKPIAALEARIAELRETAQVHGQSGALDITSEIRRLEAKSSELLASTYRSLTPWQ